MESPAYNLKHTIRLDLLVCIVETVLPFIEDVDEGCWFSSGGIVIIEAPSLAAPAADTENT